MKYIWYKKLVFITFFCFSLNSYGWFNWNFVEKAVQEHAEAYKKFARERETTDIKVETSFNPYVGLGPVEPIKFKYTPETPHLLAYINAFKKMENNVYTGAMTKCFLAGLPIGLVWAYRLVHLWDNYSLRELWIALASCLIFSSSNAIAENKLNGKHSYFDSFLNKYDNYFAHASLDSVIRSFSGFIFCFMGGILGSATYLKYNEMKEKQ